MTSSQPARQKTPSKCLLISLCGATQRAQLVECQTTSLKVVGSFPGLTSDPTPWQKHPLPHFQVEKWPGTCQRMGEYWL